MSAKSTAYECLLSILKEIEALEGELKEKNELLERQGKLLRGWLELLNAQRTSIVDELEKV
jgi:hypothetical protein